MTCGWVAANQCVVHQPEGGCSPSVEEPRLRSVHRAWRRTDETVARASFPWEHGEGDRWAEAGGVLRVLSSTQVPLGRQWAGLSPEGRSREQRYCLSVHENSLRC